VRKMWQNYSHLFQESRLHPLQPHQNDSRTILSGIETGSLHNTTTQLNQDTIHSLLTHSRHFAAIPQNPYSTSTGRPVPLSSFRHSRIRKTPTLRQTIRASFGNKGYQDGIRRQQQDYL
jgi:hypothetical protein